MSKDDWGKKYRISQHSLACRFNGIYLFLNTPDKCHATFSSLKKRTRTNNYTKQESRAGNVRRGRAGPRSHQVHCLYTQSQGAGRVGGGGAAASVVGGSRCGGAAAGRSCTVRVLKGATAAAPSRIPPHTEGTA